MTNRTLIVGSRRISLDEDGGLVDFKQWDLDVAQVLAKERGITLEKKHYQVLDYLRRLHQEGIGISMRRVGQSEVVSIKELYELFPGGPLKYACIIAGLPKPKSCI